MLETVKNRSISEAKSEFGSFYNNIEKVSVIFLLFGSFSTSCVNTMRRLSKHLLTIHHD